MELTYLLLGAIILTSGQAVPVSVNNAGSIGILPIVTCPEDHTGPTVILTPFLEGHQLAANEYVVCFQGAPQIYQCSPGLFFNWSVMSCDFHYETRSNSSTSGGSLGDLDLIPAGPIQVPVSGRPQWPIPIWSRGRYPPPLPSYPITKPDPSVIMPLPVLPAHPPPLIPRPVPPFSP